MTPEPLHSLLPFALVSHWPISPPVALKLCPRAHNINSLIKHIHFSYLTSACPGVVPLFLISSFHSFFSLADVVGRILTYRCMDAIHQSHFIILPSPQVHFTQSLPSMHYFRCIIHLHAMLYHLVPPTTPNPSPPCIDHT